MPVMKRPASIVCCSPPMPKKIRLESRALNIGSDFSGICTPLIAIKDSLGISVNHVFASDTDESCRKMMNHHFKPDFMYENAERALENFPPFAVDVYFSTFPCQTYSAAGRQGGFNDPRSTLVLQSLTYLSLIERKPRVIMMENVSKFMSPKYAPLRELIYSSLDSAGYTSLHRVVNCKSFGIPHNRPRWYLVGFIDGAAAENFKWPQEFDSLDNPPPVFTLNDFVPRSLVWKPMPSDASPSVKQAIETAYQKAVDRGMNPFISNIVVDSGASKTWSSSMVDMCPCLTATRSASMGFWSSAKGAYLDEKDMCRLMGIKPETFDIEAAEVTVRQFGKQLGNANSVTVVAKIMAEVFKATGMASPNQYMAMSKNAEEYRCGLACRR